MKQKQVQLDLKLNERIMIEERQIPKIKEKLSELMMMIRQTDASEVKKKNHREEFGMFDEGQNKEIWGEPYYNFQLVKRAHFEKEEICWIPTLKITNCKKRGA